MDIYDLLEVACIVHTMKQNSEIWKTGDTETRKEAEKANREMGDDLRNNYNIPTIYNPRDGVWYVGAVGGLKLYDLY